jgi:hypothetical protein
MAIHHIAAGQQMSIVGPAKVTIVADHEEHFTIARTDELPTPVITSLEPASMVIGDDAADQVMKVVGTGFIPGSVIVFNGYVEPTTPGAVADLSTIVKPSIFKVPVVLPITVRNGPVESEPFDFEFTETAAGRSRKKG